MDQSKFNDVITTGRLPLSGSQAFTHYTVVFSFAGLSLFGIYLMLTSEDTASFERSLYGCIIFVALSLLFYVIQKRRLRFIVMDTILNRNQLQQVIDYVASRRDWKKTTQGEHHYTATSYDGFLGGSWGEYITILFHNNKIYFNSICDPDKRTSVTAWGRNWEHARLFKKAVLLLEENIKSNSPKI